MSANRRDFVKRVGLEGVDPTLDPDAIGNLPRSVEMHELAVVAG